MSFSVDNKPIYSPKKVLVTGAAGYIGSYLVASLLRNNLDVSIVIRGNSRLDQLLAIKDRVKIFQHDGSMQSMINVITASSPDMVIHLAAKFVNQHESSDVDGLIESNVNFSTQLLEAMRVCQVKYIINTSTSWQHFEKAEYRPVNLYAASKQAFEDILSYYVDASHVQAITLVLFDTYGPNDPRKKIISLLWDAALHAKKLVLSPGHQLLDLVYISDVITAYIRVLTLFGGGFGCARYSVSSGQPLSLINLIEKFEVVTGRPLDVEFGGRLYKDREVMIPYCPSKTVPGWSPRISLDTGILKAIPEHD